ncbi:transglutaminaseTgpA domain-containing protein [Streptomyces sp. NPDC101178]|uniref:transglutaminase family protein n=1 Tax=Streptomyces sp. NPDC101178 TaxID=3366124 RepID=UPI0038048A50
MSGRARLALCAFAATLLASGALIPLVEGVGWLPQAALLLAVQSGVGALARRVPLARSLTIAAQTLVTLLLLTVVFARDQALFGVVPGPQALARLGELLVAGGEDIGMYAIPAPTTDGIRLMMVGGVLLIGLTVDALAVTFRSAAPAGLPLLALYSIAAGLGDGTTGWLWFLLAACGYLMLLLAEGRDRLSRWGRVFGGANRSPGGLSDGLSGRGGGASAPVRTGRRIGVLALGIALVVPLALPAMDSGLLGGRGGGNGKGSGGGTISAVNPLVSLKDNLNQPENRQVMTYRTNAEDPRDLYLRILSLDEFNGSDWRSSTRRLRDVPDRLPQPTGLGRDVAVTEIRTNISSSPSYQQDYLPLPYPASEVEIEGRWRYEPEGRTLIGDKGQNTGGAQYEVSSLVVEPTAAQLAAAGPPPQKLFDEYTQVPDSLPGVVAEQAREITEGSANAYERAVKLQSWFASEGGFRYSTSVSSGTGSSAIARFLRDKEGFCIHFSFAMASMARTLDIPARVAVGFTPGALQGDGSYSVGLRDAHAWPELYFEGVGWTRFEPTPSRGNTPAYTLPETPTGSPSDPAQPSAGASAAPSAVPSAPESCSPQMRRQGECGVSAAPGPTAPTDRGTPVGTVLLVGAGALAVLLLPLLPLLWRTRVRNRRLGSGGRTPADAAARALAAWQEVTDCAWDYGIAPDESLTPRKAAVRIVRLGGLDTMAAEAAHRIAGAVEQVLYAPEPRLAARLTEDALAVRAGLEANASRGARLRAKLAPRSAVRVAWAVSDRWAALVQRWTDRPGRGRWTARWRRLSRQHG